MKMTKIFGALLVGTAMMTSSAMAADNFPSRPVTMVLPFAAGGATDTLARMLSERLTDKMGQPFIVENKPGAGTMLASDYVARAKPDGYTMLMAASSLSIAPSIYSKVNYDAIKDFAPITQVASVIHILEVNPELPVNNVQELIDYLKANPGKINYGSVGVGTSTHLEGEMFKSMTGVDMIDVPYKGSAPALTDLVAGRTQVMFDAWTSSKPFVESGKLRVLAVTTEKPSPSVPNVPSISDTVPGFAAMPWLGLVAPAGTPAPIVNKIYDNVVEVLQEPAIQQKMQDLGLDIIGNTPEDFATFIAEDLQTWAKVVKDANIKLN
ncbi:Bug family tripartite tricarboxylate transporter substrate binding protein [Orrella sp. 11846]|uniref:Bug family tripartite tricarboxylate transporter substrate binding protein n=1 Tax=Orrella sp. 11846 TaxID=3409913 RepID=UPI003B5B47D1